MMDRRERRQPHRLVHQSAVGRPDRFLAFFFLFLIIILCVGVFLVLFSFFFCRGLLFVPATDSHFLERRTKKAIPAISATLGTKKKINENLEQVASEETREEQLFFGILFIFFKEPPEHVLSCWQKGPDLVLEGVLGAAESHRE